MDKVSYVVARSPKGDEAISQLTGGFLRRIYALSGCARENAARYDPKLSFSIFIFM